MFEENIVIPLEIKNENLEISIDNILKSLGFQIDIKEEYFVNTIVKCIKDSRSLLHPSGGYIIKRANTDKWKEGLMVIDQTEFQINTIIGSQIRKAEYLALFVGTIGSEIEKHSDYLFKKGDPLEGYIYNLIGSEAAESVAEIIHRELETEMLKSGLNITNRFSPGYCKWNVGEQFKLFNFFNNRNFGVTLTSSALMNPVKSISGIIGIGNDITKKEYPCRNCEEQRCMYRGKDKPD